MSTSIIVAYPITKEQLSEALGPLRGHSFETPKLYREGTKAIAACRTYRVQIEERRKLLKQDSLEYGRKVDAVAKELVELIEMVEAPLKAAKKEVDAAKERATREAAEAERRRIAEEERAKQEAEAEARREQQRAEDERLQAERRELEAQRWAMAAERAALQAERDAAAKELAEVRARKDADAKEKAATERAERMRIEAEEARINAAEAEKQRQKRLAALQPDQDKLTGMGRDILALLSTWTGVEFESDDAFQAASDTATLLGDVATKLTTWKDRQR